MNTQFQAPRRRHRLYFRLFFVYGTLFLAIGGVFAGHRYYSQNSAVTKKSFERIAFFLARDIGFPPSTTRAVQISNELNLQIRIVGPIVDFATKPEMRRWNPLVTDTSYWQDRNALRFRDRGFIYIFTDEDFKHGPRLIDFIFLGLLLGLLILSYYAVRSIFKPLGNIHSVTKQVAQGDFSVRTEVTGSGELADLADAIDQMTGRLESYFNSMKQFLVSVSHDIRSPLTRIRMAVEQIDDEKLKGSIVEEIELLDRMTSNLLEVERLNSGQVVVDKATLRASQLVSAIENEYAHRTPKLKVDLPNDFEFLGDLKRLQIALRNLVENAYRHSLGKEVLLRATKGESVVFEVMDHGEGMSEETLKNLGDAFYRPDPSRTRSTGGFGLGIRLCRAIVEVHGGELSFKSKLGEGTRAKVILPS